MATAWLIPEIEDLGNYCGSPTKMTCRQTEQCAFVISSTFGYLKVTEIFLFMHKFKSSSYGSFYGNVDPMVITSSLRQFVSERKDVYARHESEEARKRLEDSNNKGVSWNEYCDIKGYQNRQSPIDEYFSKIKKQKK